MKLERARPKDTAEITEMITKEFPYTKATSEKVESRIGSKRFHLFKAVEQGKMVGFIELQLLEPGIVRLNGLSVREEARRKGVGKLLLQFAINEMRKKGIGRITLLVKHNNKIAKSLYSEAGFRFVGLYYNKIDGTDVEEMELGLEEKQPGYVS